MRAAMIDGGREVLHGAEAEGTMAHHLDLVVHAFQGAVGNSQPGPGQDTVEMGTEHAHEFLEGLEPGAHRRMHPAFEVLFSPSRLAVIPEELKSFLQIVGAHDGRVPAHQGREALALVGPQVPGVLQQQEARSFEEGLLPAAQTAYLTPSYFIDRPVEVLHEMEAVEEDLGVGGVELNGLQVGLPHIQADDLDRGRTAPTQSGEEPGQGLFGPILAHPEQRPTFQVIDDGQIIMSFATTHFIDAEDVQRPAAATFQPIGHHAPDDRGHALPIQPEMPGRLLPAQMPGQLRHGSGQGGGDPRPKLRPRHRLHPHPAAPTAYPARTIVQHQGQISQRQVAPTAGLLDLVNGSAPPSTNPAPQRSGPQPVNFHHHLFLARLDGGHVMSFQMERFPDKGLYQHLVSTSFTSFFAQQRKVADSGCSLLRTDLQLIAFSSSQPLHTFGRGATKIGMMIRNDHADHQFQWLRKEAGVLRFDSARYQPRLHDFRHTFAVTRLVTWYREGKDVQRLLHFLSTYLGHCRVDETSVYLQMTRELLQEANRCFERYAFTEVHNG